MKKFILKWWGSLRWGYICSINIWKLISIIWVFGEWLGFMNWIVLLIGWVDWLFVVGIGEWSWCCCWVDEWGVIWVIWVIWVVEFIYCSFVFIMVIINYCYNFLGWYKYWYLIFIKKILFFFKDYIFWIVKNLFKFYMFILIFKIFIILILWKNIL